MIALPGVIGLIASAALFVSALIDSASLYLFMAQKSRHTPASTALGAFGVVLGVLSVIALIVALIFAIVGVGR